MGLGELPGSGRDGEETGRKKRKAARRGRGERGASKHRFINL